MPPEKPKAPPGPPAFSLTHCPDYWRWPEWNKACCVCGEFPDYVTGGWELAENKAGRSFKTATNIPWCSRHVPLEFEGQRGWAISRARRVREDHEASAGWWERNGNLLRPKGAGVPMPAPAPPERITTAPTPGPEDDDAPPPPEDTE